MGERTSPTPERTSSLAAAGLPLLITLLGIAISGGLLAIATHFQHVSLWAANFVLIFTLALGVDYALFIVMRFREIRGRHERPADAAAAAMDSAGRAVLFSGLTVLVSLSATFLIPSPMPRSIALGVVMSVSVVLAAAFTLLPLILARLGHRIDAGSLPWRRRAYGNAGASRMAGWGRFVCRHPKRLAAGTIATLVALALPLGHVRIGIPGQKVLAADAQSRLGFDRLEHDFGPEAVAPVTVALPRTEAARALAAMGADRDLAATQPVPTLPSSRQTVLQSALRVEPTSGAAGTAIDHLRTVLPAGSLVGAGPAELHDFKQEMQRISPPIIALILVLGFVLLLVAMQAPVIALAGTLTSLLSTAAAFGVTVLIFQDGHLSALLGFQSQGYIDFWGPVFFFAMIFAIAMDYTLFLLSSAREAWDRTGDPLDAIVEGMRRSGPVILAAAGAMFGVYATFAASGSLPAKEMGTILGMAVLLDAMLVRLVLLPAILALAGERAWWRPALVRRLLPALDLSHG